jgi:hypothetical protein
MSTNNIYVGLDNTIHTKYAKVPLHMVGGVRLNPNDLTQKVPWILQTSPLNYDPVTKKVNFVYEDEVIELYSKKEHDAFLRLNQKLLEQGLLKVFEESQESVNVENTIPDSELEKIASLRSTFNDTVDKLTSVVTLERLKKIAINSGKSIKKIQYIDSRIEALTDGDS